MEDKKVGKNLEISKCLNIFMIRNKETQIFCKIDEIICIKSEGNYIRIYHPKPSCLIMGSLKETITRLPDYFIISHKSYIVNIKRISMCNRISSHKFRIIMDNKKNIPISKSALSKINDLFI